MYYLHCSNQQPISDPQTKTLQDHLLRPTEKFQVAVLGTAKTFVSYTLNLISLHRSLMEYNGTFV